MNFDEINIKELTMELISIYEAYLKNHDDKVMRSKAQTLYVGFMGAYPVLSKPLMNAIDMLINMGTDVGYAPSEDETCHVLSGLRLELEKLEQDEA